MAERKVYPPIKVGDRFGRLRVEAQAQSRGYRKFWDCSCVCGKRRVVEGSNLRSGHTVSCGCIHQEKAKAAGVLRQTHGGSGSPEYRIWVGMRARCGNPQDKDYPKYGGRGIRVCDDWQAGFEAFLRDMGPRPSPEHSLDRHPDQNGDYEPGNCRWATTTAQNRNKRTNRCIIYKGRRLSVAELAEITATDPSLLNSRLRRG